MSFIFLPESPNGDQWLSPTICYSYYITAKYSVDVPWVAVQSKVETPTLHHLSCPGRYEQPSS